MGFAVPAELAAQGASLAEASVDLTSLAQGLAAAGDGTPVACPDSATGLAARRLTAAWAGELVACAAGLGHLGSATTHSALRLSQAAGA